MADDLKKDTSQTAEGIRVAEEQALAGRLALEMMHEIRNPLEAIGHLTYLAFLDADNGEAVRKYLRIAEEQMGLLRQIVGDTLGFARPLQARRMTGAATVLEAAIRIHQRQLDSRHIHLVKDFPEDVSANIHPGQILQVLSNLIVNALDALHPEGSLTLRVRKRGSEVHIVVADNGYGIPEKHRSRIFEPFFTTKGERGNGFGLALSKKIVEQHDGKIRVRSCVRPGRTGTAFKITLPA